MKKAIILLSVLSIMFFACKNPLKPGSAAVTSDFMEADSIPIVVADSMIAHYLDTTVSHQLDTIVKQITLYNSDLYKVFKINDITRLRLLTAAYLPTDTNVARRNMVTILLQLKQGYHSNYYYYDMKAVGPDRLCPPPPGCSPYSP